MVLRRSAVKRSTQQYINDRARALDGLRVWAALCHSGGGGGGGGGGGYGGYGMSYHITTAVAEQGDDVTRVGMGAGLGAGGIAVASGVRAGVEAGGGEGKVKRYTVGDLKYDVSRGFLMDPRVGGGGAGDQSHGDGDGQGGTGGGGGGGGGGDETEWLSTGHRWIGRTVMRVFEAEGGGAGEGAGEAGEEGEEGARGRAEGGAGDGDAVGGREVWVVHRASTPRHAPRRCLRGCPAAHSAAWRPVLLSAQCCPVLLGAQCPVPLLGDAAAAWIAWRPVRARAHRRRPVCGWVADV